MHERLLSPFCAIAALLTGCSVVLAGDVEPEPATQPVPEPTEMGPWACLGKLAAVHQDRTRSVKLNLRLTDLKSAGRPDLRTNFCYTLDPSCAPIAADDAISDADGRLVLEVPYGMHGAVLITGGDDIVSTLVYIDPPPTADENDIFIPVLDTGTVALMSMLTGKEVDPETGLVLISTPDCALQYNPFTAGVSYSLDAPGPTTEQFYLVDQLPDTTAQATGPNGVGGFVNVPPGLAAIRAVLAADDLAIGHGNFLVRKGWLTYAVISPYDH
jgi:hypothetical protein